MSDRARSLPPQGNPFWSGRAVAEFQLEQARPVDLPVPHGDDDLEESPRPIQVEAARMRSPGRRSGERTGREAFMRSPRMVTPPSSWETPGGGPKVEVLESGEKALTSQGPGLMLERCNKH